MSDTAHYFRIAPPEVLPDVAFLAPFKAIVVLEAAYTEEWQNEVSAWLVASGCRYMMAWGPNCTAWDDSVDWADREARNLDPDDQKIVMTTWHDDETLESVFWFSQFCANFSYDDVELTNALILHVSNEERRSELLQLYERSSSLAEREDDGG